MPIVKSGWANLALAVLVAACGGGVGGDDRASCAPVAGDVETIAIGPPWEVGLQRTFEIVANTDYGAGLEVGLPEPAFANLRVDGATDDGVAMVWTAVPAQVDLVMWQFGLDRPLPAPARYEWGSDVARPEVSNPFELGLWLGKVIDASRLGLDAEQRSSFDQNVAQLEALTDSEMDVLFLRQAGLLHLLEGVAVPVGEVTPLTSSIVTAVSATPIPAPGTVEVLELEDEHGCVALRVIRSADSAMLSDALLAGGASVGTVELEQTIDVQYDAVSGFVESIAVAETFTVPGAPTTTDTVRIIDLTGQLDG